MDFSDCPRFGIGAILGLIVACGLAFLDINIGVFFVYLCAGIGLLFDLHRFKKWLIARAQKKSDEKRDKTDEYHV